MLSSIHPLGERSRNQRWWLTVTAHIVGSAAGGAAMGLAAAGLGCAVAALAGAAGLGRPGAGGAGLVLAMVAAAAAGLDLARSRPPSLLRRQVDERWLHKYRGWVYGLGFGVQLGAGVLTIVTSASVYVVLAVAWVSASPALGLLVGTTFGAVRGLVLLTAAPARTPGLLRARLDRLERRRTFARPLGVLASLAVLVPAVGAVA
jgi:hypothetical protein